MMSFFSRLSVLICFVLSLPSLAKAFLCNEYEGCADLVDNLNTKQTPTPKLSEFELEVIAEKLFDDFRTYEETKDFFDRKVMLDQMKSTIKTLSENNFLDSEIILLASEIDTTICQETKPK